MFPASLAMPRTSLTVLAATALAAVVAAQAPHLVGRHDVAWPNVTGFGTPTLTARVYYPSPIGGPSAPVIPVDGGWPTLVFLHGYSLLGSDYAALGDDWARQGFVVVLLDTAQWTYIDQEHDGRAAYGALVDAATQTNDFFFGAFDTTRIALVGHSMGGGTLGLILGNNPGYRCGLALAPVSPGAGPAALVHVPFGLLVGAGDQVTPPDVFAAPYYDAVAPTSGLKFWYLMDHACDHMNLVGFSGAQHPVYRRTTEVALGFLRHFLDLDPNGLDRCIGPAALADDGLRSLRFEVAEPRLWASGPFTRGRTVRVSLAAEEGLGGILAALSASTGTPTSVGTLLLDPASAFTWTSGAVSRSGRLDAYLWTPSSPLLLGTTVAFQAIGASTQTSLVLGSVAQFVVQ
jgi:dienelactone hydrolase